MISTRSTLLQRGAGMVETMVGILIGLLVVLVVYNMLAVAEGYKRSTQSAADAQVTGLIAHFVSGLAAGNGGNGYTSAYNDLINCHFKEDGTPYSVDLVNKSTDAIKPFSVMIFPGASNDVSDAFIAWEGASPHVLWPVPVRDPSPAPGDPIVVQSPNGFSRPDKTPLPTGTAPYWAVMMTNISEPANPDFGKCALIQITDASAADDATGQVTLTQGAAPHATTIAYAGVPINDTGTPAYLLNLGPVASAQRVRYDVANNQMRTTNCLTTTGCVGQTPNPIAQNVVLMKVQYGIDTDPPPGPSAPYAASVDCWSPADGTCSTGANQDWDPVTLNNAGVPGLGTPAGHPNRIVAIRIGIVVRSDEPDVRNPSLFIPTSTTIDGKFGTRQPEWLFNCPANTNAACQGRVPISQGTAAPNVMLDGWRYRVYETVIPLRNSIFAATLPQP